MPRNGSGSYTLPPSVNPVIPNTIATSTWANTTMNDLATALTASVAKDGQTPMTGPLKLADGSVSLPGLTFNSEPSLGIFRSASGTIGIGVGSSLVESITASTHTINLDLDLNGNADISGNLTVGGTAAIPTVSGNIALAGNQTIGGTLNVTGSATAASFNGLTGAANPTGTIGLSTVNGSAATAMRSDGAPALSQAIVPTWTGLHTFDNGLTLSSGTLTLPSASIADAALSSNVPRKNSANSYTNTNTFGNVVTIGDSIVPDTNGARSVGLTGTRFGNVWSTNLNGFAVSDIARLSQANTFTADQTISAASGRLIVTDGTVTTRYLVDAANGAYLGTTTNHPLTFQAGNTNRGGISAAGGWTINAPSSGTALSISPSANLETLRSTNSSSVGVWYQLTTGTSIGSYSNHPLVLYSNSADRVTIGTAGNVTISAPSSGTALRVNGVAGDAIALLYSGVARGSGDAYLQISDSTGTKGLLGYPASDDQFYIWNSLATTMNFYNNGSVRGMVGTAGNWTINAPESGVALTATGPASNWAGNFLGANSSGASLGLLVAAGTNSSDVALGVANQAQNADLFRVIGDGAVLVGAPTGGNKGAGTLNTAGNIFVNDVRIESLPAITSTSTTLVKGQAHYITSGATLPALSSAGEWISIINNSGSSITITEHSGDTTYWTATGTSVSTVTLAARGRLFAEGIGSNIVYVSGDITGSS